MVLSEKEKMTIQDLQTQEKGCITKYGKYAEEAKDPELKNLFHSIQEKEQEHYQSLGKVLNGETPSVDLNDSQGSRYEPHACYDSMTDPQDKQDDCFLVTDCISSEKLTSGTYNSDVFCFGDSKVRNLLSHIEVEEQNHAEMLYKYKQANGMS